MFAHPAAAHLESAGLRGRGNQRSLDSPRGVVLLANLLANYSIRGRMVANQKKYPYIVELLVVDDKLDVEVNRRMMGFRRSRKI
jgi:hypothetical protein